MVRIQNSVRLLLLLPLMVMMVGCAKHTVLKPGSALLDNTKVYFTPDGQYACFEVKEKK